MSGVKFKVMAVHMRAHGDVTARIADHLRVFQHRIALFDRLRGQFVTTRNGFDCALDASVQLGDGGDDIGGG